MKIKKRRYVQIVLAVISLLIVSATILLNSPEIQRRVSVVLATELENKIGTRVDLGGVRWHFPNDIVIDSLDLYDQEGECMLSVPHVAANVEWKPLLDGCFSVRNVRMFGPTVNIYKEQAGQPVNFQYLIDAFKTKEKREKSKLSMRVNSVIVRRANVNFDVLSEEDTPHELNFNHLAISDLCTQLSLRYLADDSISLAMNQLRFSEQSGLTVKDLYFYLVGNQTGATLAGLHLKMPRTTLYADSIWCSYNAGDLKNSWVVKGHVDQTSVTPGDFAALLPSLRTFTSPISVDADFIGDRSRVNLKALECHTKEREFMLVADGALDFSADGNYYRVNLDTATINGDGWKMLEQQLPEVYAMIPQELVRMDCINVSGDALLSASETRLNLSAHCGAGTLTAVLDKNSEGKYIARLSGKFQELDRVIPQTGVKAALVELSAEGNRLDKNPLSKENLKGEQLDVWKNMALEGKLEGTVSSLNYNGYVYDQLAISCDYDTARVCANVVLDDRYGTVDMDVDLELTEDWQRIALVMSADSVNLHAMKLIATHPNTYFSTALTGNVGGNAWSNLVGKLVVDSLHLETMGHEYTMPALGVYLSNDKNKTLSVSSDFIDGSIYGDYNYTSLVQSLARKLQPHLPSLARMFAKEESEVDNLCTANFRITDTKVLNELFGIPLYVDKSVNMTATLHDKTQVFMANVVAPQLSYGDLQLSDIDISCECTADKMQLLVDGKGLVDDGVEVVANVKAHALDDVLDIAAQWSSGQDSLFAGGIFTEAVFDFDDNKHLSFCFHTDSSSMVLNNALWQLPPFHVDVNDKGVHVEDFLFYHDDQFIEIDGAVRKTDKESLNIELSHIDLDYLLSLVKLKGIDFGGSVSGELSVSKLYTSSPDVNGKLLADNFSFCEQVLGDADVTCWWNDKNQSLEFEAFVDENHRKVALVDGLYSPITSQLVLDIMADSLNLGFLNYLLDDFMGNVGGRAYGNLKLGGPLSNLDMVGALLADADFLVKPTNVYYGFCDSIRLTPGKIGFDNIRAKDRGAGEATINGWVKHQGINDFSYSLDIAASNLLGIDIPRDDYSSFYTTVYATGKVAINGSPESPLAIDVNARPEKGSLFALNISNNTVTESEAFVTFVDRSATRNNITDPRLLLENRPVQRRTGRVDDGGKANLVLNISAALNPDMALKLVMNPATDDHISAVGSGDLQIGIIDDVISLYGNYIVDHGSYRLSLQDVIHKNFDLIQGSSVVFDGDAMNAHLDITASHTVNQVPLKDLAAEAVSMGNERVNCLLKIGGTLNAPTLGFDLELPQGTEEQKNLVRSNTSTEEQMNMQFVYLLGLGRFYTYDATQTTEGTQGGSSSMESFINNTISGQISSLLSAIIDNDNWNISGNVHTENRMGEVAATEGGTWDNMEIEGILEGRLLDNRLLVNGNFGYRNNPMYASNFIGDFDLRYLLSADGDWSVKGYNKTNDRYFSKTSLTTQGVGLMFQKEFDSLFRHKRKTDSIEPLYVPDSLTVDR